ncbi:ATP-binding protein [Flammeovirga yaeyamensis]|uniref:ATP-binding protein n=1 Tax=Flammeovirga yaeyamensis TaxID=367791 RepID=A0AAX1N1Z6_9BACT|nr:AAA family ATPase [Flammeovirga yaeyamensis]MBB3698170.1 putative kinase [Flammeovirga yaeyamensis]NMF34473.1 ATP-binding protein [Flammeovirga yaeyamensis]QWG01452.1 ATP-binding protein [Flammeovirga yaeyamensis]
MGRLLLLRGLPGSGKTTLAQSLGGSIEADDFMVNDRGEYEFDVRKLDYAHKSCLEMAEMCIRRGQELVIVSNTFTTEQEMIPYFKVAEKYNYQVSSVIVENRHDGISVHNVPDEKVVNMMRRFEVRL